MTTTDGIINNFVNGDDLEIERSVISIPTGVLLQSAWFMVKRKYSDSDTDALISKTITTVNVAGVGWIEDTGADGTGLIHFYLTPTETALLTALSEYPYSIKIKLNNDKLNTPELGVIVASPAVKQGSI